METTFEQLVSTLSEKLKGMASTETVIGEEFKMGEYTCKPVIKVGLGFGGGSGDGKTKHKSEIQSGTGGGGALGVTPVGFLATKGDEISFIPSNDRQGISKLLEKVPDIMEKVMEMKKEKEQEKE